MFDSWIIFVAGNGKLDFAEFVSLVAKIYKNPHDLEEEMKEAFRRFDKDGNGVISRSELRDFLTRFGEPLDEVEIEEFFNKADLNMDGNINYEGNANSP